MIEYTESKENQLKILIQFIELYYYGILKTMCIGIAIILVIVSPQSSFSILSILFYLICFGVAGFMLYTFEIHTMSFSDIRRIFQQRQRFNYKSTGKDEDIESEFKIARLTDTQESKYGSI